VPLGMTLRTHVSVSADSSISYSFDWFSEQVMVSSTFQVRALLVNPFEPTGWLTGQEEPERIASCVIG